MGLLKDKSILITGGSRGIGEALVKAMAAEGANVGFSYRSSAESAERVVKEAGDHGTTIKAYQSDAADYNQAEELVKAFIGDFGQIDALINNAGITADTLMLRMSEDQWDCVIDVNLKSVFNLTKHAMRPMLKARAGSIINMSSVVGVFGNAGQANYAASKAGILGFSKSIAKEVGSRGIRCNAIAPGFIETDMTDALTDEQRKGYTDNIPLGRLGTGQDIADICTFLASDRSKYITGQVISVCGGLNI
jgi:3-oxoacyl-[acyl-carrier protein] reductase